MADKKGAKVMEEKAKESRACERADKKLVKEVFNVLQNVCTQVGGKRSKKDRAPAADVIDALVTAAVDAVSDLSLCHIDLSSDATGADMVVAAAAAPLPLAKRRKK